VKSTLEKKNGRRQDKIHDCRVSVFFSRWTKVFFFHDLETNRDVFFRRLRVLVMSNIAMVVGVVLSSQVLYGVES
jgi:hypothetical protein